MGNLHLFSISHSLNLKLPCYYNVTHTIEFLLICRQINGTSSHDTFFLYERELGFTKL